VTNIYAQWEPPLKKILLDLIQNKLSESIFPYLEGNSKEKYVLFLSFVCALSLPPSLFLSPTLSLGSLRDQRKDNVDLIEIINYSNAGHRI
jgi:hypothetical protein